VSRHHLNGKPEPVTVTCQGTLSSTASTAKNGTASEPKCSKVG
jgi:hypothetical protein